MICLVRERLEGPVTELKAECIVALPIAFAEVAQE